MSKSILQSEKKCFVTGATSGLHKHHIFFGAGRRETSEKYGFWVYLRADWHNLASYGVHNDAEFRHYLERLCQSKFEETHSREEFVEIIGKNYLD